MVTKNFNFEAYQGRDFAQIFTITDSAGQPVNISAYTDINFNAKRSLGGTPVLAKSKIGGGITLVGGGTAGQFQLALLRADTTPLSGFYFFEIYTTNGGLENTAFTGRLQIGAGPIWTYSGDPTTSSRDALRYLIGDTIADDQLIMDPELDFALTQRASIYGAAAIACRSLASRLSREADTVDKDLRDSISQRARSYSRMAVDYEAQAITRGGGLPYAGGISIANKKLQESNTDRVQPQYTIGMDDNLIDPEAPVSGETPGEPAP